MTARDYVIDKIISLRRKGYNVSPEDNLVYISSEFYKVIMIEDTENNGLISLNEHGLYIMGYRTFVVASNDAPDIEFTVR